MAREITYLKKLHHKNIIQIYEIIETREELNIVMENANGGELFNYIVANKKLSEPEAGWFLVQLIDALEHIHSFKIAHRDLKPENMLLAEGNLLKIIDFGLSNSYETSKTLSSGCGSPCYAAPEMILGKKYEGDAVDIWSTGIVIFAMTCGYLPFEDEDNDKVYRKILDCKLDFPSHVSKECKDLIVRILNTDSKKRYKFEDIKAHQFYKQGLEFKPLPEETDFDLTSMIGQISLEKMVEAGFDKKEIIPMIKKNKHNNLTTTFKLLYRKISTLISHDKENNFKNLLLGSQTCNSSWNSNSKLSEDSSLFEDNKRQEGFTPKSSEKKFTSETLRIEEKGQQSEFRKKINASIHFDPRNVGEEVKKGLPKLRQMDDVSYMRHRSTSVVADYEGVDKEDKYSVMNVIKEVVKEKKEIGAGTPNRADIKKMNKSVVSQPETVNPNPSKKKSTFEKSNTISAKKEQRYLIISNRNKDET